MKLDDPKTYRMFFALGLLTGGIGIIFKLISVMIVGIVLLILSKYGMRKEHKQKKEKGEIR